MACDGQAITGTKLYQIAAMRARADYSALP
jgi:hypothetical protein